MDQKLAEKSNSWEEAQLLVIKLFGQPEKKLDILRSIYLPGANSHETNESQIQFFFRKRRPG